MRSPGVSPAANARPRFGFLPAGVVGPFAVVVVEFPLAGVVVEAAIDVVLPVAVVDAVVVDVPCAAEIDVSFTGADVVPCAAAGEMNRRTRDQKERREFIAGNARWPKTRALKQGKS